MKRIAIFCDGTWNQLSAPNPTHVARLSRAVTPTAVDGKPQLVYYQQGVGTGRGSNAVARKMDKWLGGALGWGLDDNIIEAYRNLIFWYEPDDEIFIFGFSRGAYTARSLAGLIRTAGIPPRAHLGRLHEAVDLYRARGHDTHPDGEKVRAFRKEFAPETATSEADLTWRRDQGDKDSFFLRLAYMGVWDTGGLWGCQGYSGRPPSWSIRSMLFMMRPCHVLSGRRVMQWRLTSDAGSIRPAFGTIWKPSMEMR